MAARALPSVGAHGGLTRYLEEIRQFPMLEPQRGVHARQELARAWRPRRCAPARHLASSPRGAHRHGLSRLWPARRRGHLRRQCRPDAGGEAFRSRQGLPPRDLRHVVDPGGDPGIHPALVEPGEDGHHGGAEEAVLQPAQDQGSAQGARRGRSQARPGEADRDQARRDRGGRRLHEPPARRRYRRSMRRCATTPKAANGRTGWSTTPWTRRRRLPNPRSATSAATC